jgi:N,N'-diacetyllegionaminate synthase
MARVVAELCQNHLGDRAILGDLIHAAAEAGADYAKVQTIRVRELTCRARFEEGLVEDGVVRCIRRPYQAEHDRLRPLELSPETEVWFREECARARIRPLTSVFTCAAVADVLAAGFDEVKVPSYDCASLPLLRRLVGEFRHVYVSTGATEDDEIAAAAGVLSGQSFSFLHCVTIYPTPLAAMNLRRIDWLRRFTPSVGFSDHSLFARDGLSASLCALALGADVIERHFTILPAERTKDGPVSVTPEALADLCRWAKAPRADVERHVRETVPQDEEAAMLGVPTHALSPEELLNRDYYRGRFASRVGDDFVYNWEDKALP